MILWRTIVLHTNTRNMTRLPLPEAPLRALESMVQITSAHELSTHKIMSFTIV